MNRTHTTVLAPSHTPFPNFGIYHTASSAFILSTISLSKTSVFSFTLSAHCFSSLTVTHNWVSNVVAHEPPAYNSHLPRECLFWDLLSPFEKKTKQFTNFGILFIHKAAPNSSAFSQTFYKWSITSTVVTCFIHQYISNMKELVTLLNFLNIISRMIMIFGAQFRTNQNLNEQHILP